MFGNAQWVDLYHVCAGLQSLEVVHALFVGYDITPVFHHQAHALDTGQTHTATGIVVIEFRVDDASLHGAAGILDHAYGRRTVRHQGVNRVSRRLLHVVSAASQCPGAYGKRAVDVEPGMAAELQPVVRVARGVVECKVQAISANDRVGDSIAVDACAAAAVAQQGRQFDLYIECMTGHMLCCQGDVVCNRGIVGATLQLQLQTATVWLIDFTVAEHDTAKNKAAARQQLILDDDGGARTVRC